MKPLIKHPSLDPEQFPNYRPISNLMFIYKLCERVVAVHLTKYPTDNFLMEQFQSAHKPIHSSESALLKVQDDFLQAIDNDQCKYLCSAISQQRLMRLIIAVCFLDSPTDLA